MFGLLLLKNQMQQKIWNAVKALSLYIYKQHKDIVKPEKRGPTFKKV
jgi:hypothetical protein